MSTRAAARGPAEFCERFAVDLPIVGAPMAFVAGGALAAAIADAGALGLIGGGYGDEAWIAEQLDIAGTARVRAGRVGVGLITWRVRPDIIERLAARGVRTFCLSFGDPRPFVPVITRAGGRVLCQVQTSEDAAIAAAAGVDAIVAQGSEAGGHGCHNDGVERLLHSVLAATAAERVPVLAAGAISTAHDVARTMAWGADGVMVGTRLYATHEALDTDAAKRRLVEAGAGDSVRTSVFDQVRGPEWPSGHDGRALRNALVDRWEQAPDDVLAHLQAERARYRGAADTDDLSRRVVWAGSGVDRIDDIAPAASVIARLADGCPRADRIDRPH